MLHTNLSFTAYTDLSINTNKHSFFTNIISRKNLTKVQTLCQHINMELYRVLAEMTDNNNLTKSLKQKMIAYMQTPQNYSFDNLFQENFSELYDNTIGNRFCRFILINVLKHLFTEELMPSIIDVYKKETLTFMVSCANSSEMSNTIAVVNDDGINRLFGWVLFKLKKKYKKVIDKNSVSSIYEGKYMMLCDMSVMVNDVIHNT